MNIGPYRIIRKLGEGGMSNVFLTEDVRTGRVVALKLLAPRVVADQTYRLRLLREAHAVASLKHPNITALYEADQFQDQPYIAMEWVAGPTLADLLKDGKTFTPQQVVDIGVVAIGRGRDFVGAIGAVHEAILSKRHRYVRCRALGPVGTRHEVIRRRRSHVGTLHCTPAWTIRGSWSSRRAAPPYERTLPTRSSGSARRCAMPAAARLSVATSSRRATA